VSQWQDLPEGIYAQGLKSLKEVVHFYNTRDVYPFDVESGHCPAGTKEKVNCWPAPEVRQT
jgi:cytochrome c peroxidase